MSAIEDVIARSRQPGDFSERQTFTVARQRAIQKMRKFALADPLYYILELIQAATANGAEYVDIQVHGDTVGFSYVGGGFSKEELVQIFDFLFASKDDLDYADIRQLALGLNALMLAEPDEIIIESGDGTLSGTTRVRIDGKNDLVEVGTPEKELKGTFVRANGIDRRKLRSKSGERRVIEDRCLTAPVPIFFNDDSLFGYRTMRTPNLFGYNDVVTFDEGDLYGAIGKATNEYTNSFKLLTWGVWIESVKFEVLADIRIGGVIAFDRLHKTADHSGIVKDEVFEEMWARLRPYARQVRDGRTGSAVYDIRLSDGTPLTASEIRNTLRSSKHAVIVRDKEVSNPTASSIADEIGTALDAPVLVVGGEDRGTIDLLAGPDVELIRPQLTRNELNFYRRPESGEMPRPWLIGKMETDAIEIGTLSEWIVQEELVRGNSVGARRRYFGEVDSNAEVKTTIYTPVESDHRGDLSVEIRTSNRTVWSGTVASTFPGHALVIDIPGASPSALCSDVAKTDTPVAQAIAEVMARHVEESLEKATLRVLRSVGRTDFDADSTAARIVLAALARSVIRRLRGQGEEDEGIQFALLDDTLPPRLLELPVLRTLSGEPVTARTLEQLLHECHGVVYGVVPDVEPDLEGLDESRILDLDLHSERMLINLVGEASYVRVDRRDILASSGGIQCRDLAVGLRDFPDDVPLLVESTGDGPVDPAHADEHLETLVRQLKQVFQGTAANESSSELRRQAARHLIWFLTRLDWTAAVPPADFGVSHLQLFRTGYGAVASFSDVVEPLLSEDGVPMFDGWSVDAAEMGELTLGGAGPEERRPSRDISLAMNPFVFHALEAIGDVRPLFDFDLSAAEAQANGATDDVPFLAHQEVDSTYARGVIGIPTEPVDAPAIALIDSDEERVHLLSDVAREFGIVGKLHIQGASVPRSALAQTCRSEAIKLFAELIDQMAGFDRGSTEFRRAFACTLGYAGHHVTMTREPDGRVILDVLDPTAQRILDLPIFPTELGVAVSAQRFLREFLANLAHGSRVHTTTLASDAPEFMREWLEEMLDEKHIVRPASHGAAPEKQADASPPPRASSELEGWLFRALDQLRPDDDADEISTRIALVEPDDSGQVVHDQYGSIELPPDQLYVYIHRSDDSVLIINSRHWLVDRAREGMKTDPDSLAWLLLSAYAHINARRVEVTNDHELLFQTEVVERVRRGDFGR